MFLTPTPSRSEYRYSDTVLITPGPEFWMRDASSSLSWPLLRAIRYRVYGRRPEQSGACPSTALRFAQGARAKPKDAVQPIGICSKRKRVASRSIGATHDML